MKFVTWCLIAIVAILSLWNYGLNEQLLRVRGHLLEIDRHLGYHSRFPFEGVWDADYTDENYRDLEYIGIGFIERNKESKR